MSTSRGLLSPAALPVKPGDPVHLRATAGAPRALSRPQPVRGVVAGRTGRGTGGMSRGEGTMVLFVIKNNCS